MLKKIMEPSLIIKNKVSNKITCDCLFATGKIGADLDITRKSGSTTLDMAYVASIRYDGFFEKFKIMGLLQVLF